MPHRPLPGPFPSGRRCAEGNRSRTAQELGITRTTLLQKLRQFGLDA
ncbi:MAG: hypothetical protein CME13_08100 [Gemmatimonadetes bacterium]|nr:hypothetical protein [Gemmatimonadota bacterium]MBU07918.1 hypothetical protein [Gemmatimonadota bacterium]